MNGAEIAGVRSQESGVRSQESGSSGCLLCGKWLKNEHGVSIHVGKVHNNPKRGEDHGTKTKA